MKTFLSAMIVFIVMQAVSAASEDPCHEICQERDESLGECINLDGPIDGDPCKACEGGEVVNVDGPISGNPCKACEGGDIVNVDGPINGSPCKACQGGEVVNVDGPIEGDPCKACQGGEVVNADGPIEGDPCKACQEGEIVNVDGPIEGDPCKACQEGEIVNVDGPIEGDPCKACQEGEIVNVDGPIEGDPCKACQEGEIVNVDGPIEGDPCKACQEGEIVNVDGPIEGDPCKACQDGEIVNVDGPLDGDPCKACQEGEIVNVDGPIEGDPCKACQEGEIVNVDGPLDGDPCKACEGGEIVNVDGPIEGDPCKACQDGELVNMDGPIEGEPCLVCIDGEVTKKEKGDPPLPYQIWNEEICEWEDPPKPPSPGRCYVWNAQQRKWLPVSGPIEGEPCKECRNGEVVGKTGIIPDDVCYKCDDGERIENDLCINRVSGLKTALRNLNIEVKLSEAFENDAKSLDYPINSAHSLMVNAIAVLLYRGVITMGPAGNAGDLAMDAIMAILATAHPDFQSDEQLQNALKLARQLQALCVDFRQAVNGYISHYNNELKDAYNEYKLAASSFNECISNYPGACGCNLMRQTLNGLSCPHETVKLYDIPAWPEWPYRNCP